MRSSAELHADTLAGWTALHGQRVLDIGCGNGSFLLELARRGADVAGVEIAADKLARARDAGVAADRLHLGRAEALPFPAGAFDIACCIFSFHHFPADTQAGALAEAARVLRPGGALFVVEPTVEGALTEVLSPVEDETEVRTHSHALLDGPPPHPDLQRRERRRYETARPFGGPEDVIKLLVEVDPGRADRAADPAIRDAVASRFAARADRLEGGGYALRQPCVAYLFGRA